MTVRLDKDVIHLEGGCGVEDAEPLASALETRMFERVNLSACRHLHSAVVQALLAFPCRLEGGPTEGFLAQYVLPALQQSDAGRGAPPTPAENSMECSE